MKILPINPTINDYIITNSWKEYTFVSLIKWDNDILIHATAYETSLEMNEKLNWEEVLKTYFTAVLNDKAFI